MENVTEETTVFESMDSKFRYVLLVAQRAEQIMRGARTKVELATDKPTTVAKAEIDGGLIDWDYGPAPEPELELEGLGEEAEEVEAAEEAEATETEDEEEVH